jgi:hypothetical protein
MGEGAEDMGSDYGDEYDEEVEEQEEADNHNKRDKKKKEKESMYASAEDFAELLDKGAETDAKKKDKDFSKKRDHSEFAAA